MSGLPAALAPWSEALSIFPENIQLSIGPWLPRLAATLGPTRARVDMRAGDPDGYAGLARRGPYDRLLLSEWLYAMEAPAEFVRRASMNELVFVELARRAPVGSHRSVVLLDAGPSQIGSPRLVHVAALVVLVTRAERAGADIGWGVLQDSQLKLHSSLTRANIKALLQGRTTMEVDDECLFRWADHVHCEAADDLWFVGGHRARDPRRFPDASFLEVDDVLEPDRRQVQAQLHHRGRPSRALLLDLPPPQACVRLLRDPFEAHRREPPRMLLRNPYGKSALFFTQAHRRLITTDAAGNLVFLSAPKGRHNQAPRPRWVTPSCASTIAVAARGRRTFRVKVDDGVVTADLLCSQGYESQTWVNATIPETLNLRSPARDDPVTPGVVLGRGHHTLLFTDTEGRLYRIQRDRDEVELIDERVHGLTYRSGGYAVYVRLATSPEDGHTPAAPNVDLIQLCSIGEDGPPRYVVSHHQVADPRVFFAPKVPQQMPYDDLHRAVETQPNTWTVFGAPGTKSVIHTLSHEEVIGCVVGQHGGRGDALVTLGEDRRTFSLVSTNDRRTLVSVEAPVVEATMSPYALLLAYRTQHAVVIWSLPDRAPVQRLNFTDAAPEDA